MTIMKMKIPKSKRKFDAHFIPIVLAVKNVNSSIPPLPASKTPLFFFFVRNPTFLRNFPACPFGDQCLYIHPQIPCKFGLACSRQGCNYSHPTSPLIPGMGMGMMPGMPMTMPGAMPAGIPCRHGFACSRSGCSYSHPPVRKILETFLFFFPGKFSKLRNFFFFPFISGCL